MSNAVRNFNCLYEIDRNQSDLVKEMRKTFKLGDKFHSNMNINTMSNHESSIRNILINPTSVMKDYDHSVNSQNNFDQNSNK